MKPRTIDISYSQDMIDTIARHLLNHQDDVRRYIESTPEEYKKFCEEWDKTHAPAG